MIQRIQTLFLLIASLLLFLSFFTPFANITATNPVDITSLYSYKMVSVAHGEHTTSPFLTNGLLIGVAAIMCVATIFIYRKRKLQMSLCIASMVFIFVSCNLYVLLILSAISNVNASISYNIQTVFPVISLTFVYLAYRAIKKDEKLIKSIDRIR